MNLFSFVKDHIAILDVLSEYLTLKRAGGYYKSTCPFHHEKTASFTVSPDKQIFYCFGCHTSGDAISFLALIENCSQKDAAYMLIERYKLTLPSALTYKTSDYDNTEKNHYFEICKTVALWCHKKLLETIDAQRYFYNRGFQQHDFTHFTLGYFPGGTVGINDLLATVKKKSILINDLIETHILIQGRTTFYSPFEERLIFPIKDSLGRFCGFGGRTFKEMDTRPKYYNSKESSYFIKGSLLFGMDLAKKNIQSSGIAFLVEGYIDCMAMVKHGITNTIATLGTACTLEHLKQLARYCEHLYIIYDNDTAGNNAVLRLTELCWQVNLELKVIVLPENHDPDSFLAQGGSIQSLMGSAHDIFHFFITKMGHQFVTRPLNQKIQIIRTFLATAITVQDQLKRDMILQKAATIFDIPLASLIEEAQKMVEKSQEKISPEDADQKHKAHDITVSLLEKRIFCAIINNKHFLDNKNCQKIIRYLQSPLQAIVEKFKMNEGHDSHVTFSSFFDTLDESEKKYVGNLLLKEDEKIDQAAFENLLVQLQKKQWKIIVNSIKIKLARAKQEKDMVKTSEILRDFIELQSTFLPDKS